MSVLALAAVTKAAIPPGVAVFALGRHDTLAAAVHQGPDSVVVKSPLPDPLVPIVQFMFQQPGWVLGLEMLLGGALAAGVAWLMWTRRIWMFGWFRRAPRRAQLMFVGANLAVVLVALGTGAYGYNYMMHDNDFCKGCHIFIPSGQPWVHPDTGNYLLVNALEGKHDTLSCHNCHPFEIRAQTKELFYWIVQRPDKIPPHGKVPRATCERCHAQEHPDSTKPWQAARLLAGHRVHFESDSSSLRGLECLSCHARSAHRFVPSDTTCTQKGCHNEIKIRLGRMVSAQSQMHCTLCHRFDAQTPAIVSRDSARSVLIPGGEQCTACHQMQALTARFNFARDPHQAQCGFCHNPHTQSRPAGADSACASCHQEWRDVAFHSGAIHRGAVRPEACTQCHQPHAARVDASDCTGCHTAMRQLRHERGPLLPTRFDTTATLRTSTVPPPPEPRGKGDAPVVDDPPPAPPSPAEGHTLGAGTTPAPRVVGDTFAHARHQALACITCHDPKSDKKLTFTPPRGCQICHHQAPERNACATCHTPEEMARPESLQVTVAAGGAPARARAVAFPHARHREVACLECHREAVTLAPTPAAATCTACHERHAATTVNCAACHSSIPAAAHAPPADAHRACAACHAPQVVAALSPTRNLCLTCHAGQRDHQPGAECTTCHLGAPPAEYRPRLGAAGASR